MRLPTRYDPLPPTLRAALLDRHAHQDERAPDSLRWSRAERDLGLVRRLGETEDGRTIVCWLRAGQLYGGS